MTGDEVAGTYVTGGDARPAPAVGAGAAEGTEEVPLGWLDPRPDAVAVVGVTDQRPVGPLDDPEANAFRYPCDDVPAPELRPPSGVVE